MTRDVAFCHSPLLIHGAIETLLPGVQGHENDGYHLKVSRSWPSVTSEQLDKVTAEILRRINEFPRLKARVFVWETAAKLSAPGVERLNKLLSHVTAGTEICGAAADEIERLRGELEAARRVSVA